MSYSFSKKQKGFTLVEALVAISVLMVAVASPLYIAQKGLAAAVLSRDQMTASFLAQDGIEAVKNIRDQVAISQASGSWLNGLQSCVCSVGQIQCSTFAAGANYCNIDTTVPNLADTNAGAVHAKNDANNNPLKETFNADGSFLKYDLTGSVSSKYTRQISIFSTSTNPNEAEINVRVSWMAPIGQQNIDLSDFIYNYSENDLQ